MSLRRHLVRFAILLAICTSASCSSPARVHSGTLQSTVPPNGTATVVEVTTALNLSLGTILTDADGMTLYHYAPERDGQIGCTGGCSQTWPPLIVPPGGRIEAGPGVAGRLGATRRPDGNIQVTFDGIPLYRFSKDAHPGQASGEGMGGLWTAVVVPGTGTTSVPLHPLA